MIIIVEGIDRVGKTTLCNILSEMLSDETKKINVFKDNFVYSEIKSDVSSEKANTFLNLVENGIVQDVIVDRFHWSEKVYAICNKRKYNERAFLDSEKRLVEISKKQVVLIVLVMPENINRSIQEHGSDLLQHQNLFEMIYKNSELPKCIIKYSDIVNQEKLKKILWEVCHI